mmetsp:Transcript_62270/g.181921  ORF Transcript_62270/g.181921 Transcript_62270/m.181921 type:complete len:117 (+) Transcript_62270:830-1180(+)
MLLYVLKPIISKAACILVVPDLLTPASTTSSPELFTLPSFADGTAGQRQPSIALLFNDRKIGRKTMALLASHRNHTVQTCLQFMHVSAPMASAVPCPAWHGSDAKHAQRILSQHGS